MLTTGCNICESKDSEFMFKKHGFDVARCKKCGLIYVDIKMENLKEIYNKDYYSGDKVTQSKYNDKETYEKMRLLNEYHRYHDYMGNREQKEKCLEKVLERIEIIKKSGKILDVGCAAGFFLNIAKKHEWETYGVEISEYASDYARNKLGLNVFTGELMGAKFPDKHFDVIAMWDVIEHMQDPSASLKEAHRILKDDGLLIITTGDVSSLNAKIEGIENWYLMAPPWHLYYFSKETLKKILKKNRFKPIELRTDGITLSNNHIIRKIRYIRFIFGVVESFLVKRLKIGNAIEIYVMKNDKENTII